VSRAIGLLRVLASGPRQGWRLSDLAATCSLDRATTHRTLKALVAERLVVQDTARRYAPGPLLFELGLSYSRPAALVQAARPSLRSIASEFGAVGSLWLRSGSDVVCAERVGTTRTKVFIDVGTRRPLASMAPGISILLVLRAAERRTLIAANLRQMERLFPGRLAEFRRMIARSEFQIVKLRQAH
jgi:DNA-binding IclR family transcriptional regulator